MNRLYGLLVTILLIASVVVAQTKVDCNNPPQSDPDKCCKTPMFFTDEMVKSCETAVKAKGNNITADCIANCLLSKNNAVNGDGSLKKEVLAAFLIKQANDPVWNAGITKSVNTCVEDGVKRSADFAAIAKTTQCPPLPLFSVDCAYMQLFKSCPADRWSNSAACTTLKNYVAQCSLV